MEFSKYFLYTIIVSTIFFTSLTANADESLPKEICKEVGIPLCDAKSVDAFSAVDLNADGKKEIIFAYDGGSCGEQHYVFTQKNMKWVEIANWCGMDGGAYTFDGKTYPNTTKK